MECVKPLELVGLVCSEVPLVDLVQAVQAGEELVGVKEGSKKPVILLKGLWDGA